MCGIIAITGSPHASDTIMEGLRRLEYRGYDSAGVALLSHGTITRTRAEGKLANLAARLAAAPLEGHTGIGHTRWATHGIPSEDNAHPHATGRVAVVHNGIIENFQELRDELAAKGYRFTSQTDSEVIPVLITSYLDQGQSPQAAAASAIARLRGAFAFAALFSDAPELIIGARHGAPLAVGYGEDCMLLASDASALASLAGHVAYLEDGDRVEITPSGATLYDAGGKTVTRQKHAVTHASAVEKGNYRHFMQKEIYEQPAAVADTLAAHYNPATRHFELPSLPFDLARIRRIHLVACGTSYYAALTARYWLEQIARIPTEVDIASEFRYREPILTEDGLTVVISQSGETADTLAALRYARARQKVLAIVNVAESTIAREASAVLRTLAGPEIGVASTKAFTTQLAVLFGLTLALAQTRSLNDEEVRRASHALLTAPALIAEALKLDDAVAALAPLVAEARDVLYLGRGTSFALAHEGALKLKEISYIHAEAYAAGEMKHGPIALIDEHVPIIALAPYDDLFEKTASNLQEAAARGGKIVLFSSAKGCEALASITAAHITLPDVPDAIAPLVYAVPMQLLAYHVALLKGTDVDQPRNLAKSVTVE